jgi:dihydrofolate reductase
MRELSVQTIVQESPLHRNAVPAIAASVYANPKGNVMRKIRIIEHISLDGVIQAPGGPNEDDGDFPYGGWAVPFHDDAAGEAIVAGQGEGFDLLLGRRTYDIFSGYWPKQSGSMANSLNAATKHVATHRPDSLGWGPVEDLGRDVVEGVRRVKAQDGPDLIVWGSSTLTPVLLEHGLFDEILLLVFPVLLGTGKRFFSGGAPPRELALVGTKAASSGIVISTYRPSGPLRTGSFDDAIA